MATAAYVGFKPLHEAHAIEQLIAAVQFDRPIDDAAIRAVSEVMTRFQDALPGRSEIRGMGFQVGPLGVTPIAPSTSELPSGVVRTLSDGRGVVVKELRVDRQSVVFRSLVYTRWDAVWGEAGRYLSELLPVLGETNVAAYSLAYVDKFVWSGTPETCRPALLLRQGSPYISPGIFDATDLWHCHSGRFVTSGGPSRRLEVVDLDCVDETDSGMSDAKPVRVVRISTTITDQFNQPGFQSVTMPAAQGTAHLERGFVELHTLLKTVFAAIVSDEAATQVGLNANAG